MKVAVHPPKTPVTKGSKGVAKATIPNVCKMPGPPAPFVPSPLPNIAQSDSSPKGYTKTVKVQGKTVAVRGASFKSKGDAASKGTGGGLVSANTHGPAKFITPGSLTVKFDGKSVHLLGEPMLNNCGASGMPPNTGATMGGVNQAKKKKKKKCPCDTFRTEEKDYDESIAEAEQRVDEAAAEEKAATDAANAATTALENPPPGSKMATLRQKAKQATKAVPRAQAYTRKQQQRLDSARREKQVADDVGGAKNIRLLCAACGNEITDFDVVTDDGRVKEVKSSQGGFRKDQFDKQRSLIEKSKVLGNGFKMKVAVPPGDGAALAADHSELDGRVQEH